jgi:hypothetical protein
MLDTIRINEPVFGNPLHLFGEGCNVWEEQAFEETIAWLEEKLVR